MADFQPREHSIQADLGLLKEARDFAERAAADFGLDDGACYDVKLAMSEAVTNAIQHGSSVSGRPDQDPGARRRAARSSSRCWTPGASCPACCSRGELEESGRGLEFIRVLMDEVDLHPTDDGTLMRFTKRRDG